DAAGVRAGEPGVRGREDGEDRLEDGGGRTAHVGLGGDHGHGAGAAVDEDVEELRARARRERRAGGGAPLRTRRRREVCPRDGWDRRGGPASLGEVLGWWMDVAPDKGDVPHVGGAGAARWADAGLLLRNTGTADTGGV